MMNLPVKKPRAYFKWQHLVLVIPLVLLLISALPNFYSSQMNIRLAPKSETSQAITPQSIKALFAGQEQQLAGISANKAYTDLVLSDEANLAQMEKALQEKLSADYDITRVQTSNAPAWLQALG